jgi:SAM-dependent methyltransferase
VSEGHPSDAGRIPASLLSLLRCPRCGTELRMRGDLVCTTGHGYPVKNGIPRFTAPSTYADNFGFEWTTFPKVQLDSENQNESETTFRAKTGLTPEDVAGKSVLDGGCGMGRFSDVVARWHAHQVVAVDLTNAVDAAAENLRGHAGTHVLQADLRRLPLAPEAFDIVFSIGVLHHTPNTREAFMRLAEMVKPGGLLCVWVYSSKLRISLAGGELIRLYTRRMPSDRLLRLVRRVEPPITRLKARLPARLPLLVDMAIPISNQPDPQWRLLDTFDWYSPRFQWKHSYAEVERWFSDLRWNDIRRLPQPVAVRGRKPA